MVAVLQHQEGVLDLGAAAMTSLQFDHLPVPVGDEAVLAAGRRRGPAGNPAPGSLREAVLVVSATSAAPTIQQGMGLRSLSGIAWMILRRLLCWRVMLD